MSNLYKPGQKYIFFGGIIFVLSSYSFLGAANKLDEKIQLLDMKYHNDYMKHI